VWGRYAHANYHVPVGGGYKMTTHLKSQTTNFLLIIQLLTDNDDDYGSFALENYHYQAFSGQNMRNFSIFLQNPLRIRIEKKTY